MVNVCVVYCTQFREIYLSICVCSNVFDQVQLLNDGDCYRACAEVQEYLCSLPILDAILRLLDGHPIESGGHHWSKEHLHKHAIVAISRRGSR